MPPQLERGPGGPPEASPLWPLVVLLGEIAARVDRQEATAGTTRRIGDTDRGSDVESGPPVHRSDDPSSEGRP